MADLRGSWIPETEEEMAFVTEVNERAKAAYENGVDKDDIVSGLAFLTASVAKHDDAERPGATIEEPEPPAKREDCPECGEKIESVRPFMGGEAIVRPCGCNVTIHQVPGWIDMPGDDDD